MKKKIGEEILKWIAVFSAGLALLLFFIFAGTKSDNISLLPDLSKAVEISRKVLFVFDDGRSEIRNLPASVQSGVPFTQYIDLSSYGETDGKTIAVIVNYSRMTCIADGRPIFFCETGRLPMVGTGEKSLQMIDLPANMARPEIALRFEPLPGAEKIGKTYPVFYGTRTSIVVTNLLRRDLPVLIFAFLLFAVFLMGLVYTLLHFRREYYDSSVFFTGLLCFFISIYFTTQTWSVNYVFSSRYAGVYFVEYTALMLMATPALALLKGRLDPRFDRFFYWAVVLAFLNLIAQYLLVLGEYSDFKQMLPVNLFLLGASDLLAVAAFFFTDGEKYPEKRPLLISMMPLLINVALSLLPYWFYGRLLCMALILCNVMFFVGVQVYKVFKSYAALHRETAQGRMYKKLAFADTMTGLGNRTAYINALRKIREKELSLWILSIDLNDLKWVNDTKGHFYGDRMIMRFAEILRKSLAGMPRNTVFRIGGDEFVVFIFAGESFPIENVVQGMRTLARNMAQEQMPIFFGAGYSYHRGGTGKKLEDTLSEADFLMYEDKERQKQRRRAEWKE